MKVEHSCNNTTKKNKNHSKMKYHRINIFNQPPKENGQTLKNNTELSDILKDLSNAFMTSIQTKKDNKVFALDPYSKSKKNYDLGKNTKLMSPIKNKMNVQTRENSDKKDNKKKTYSIDSETLFKERDLKDIHLTFTKGPKLKKTSKFPKTRERTNTFETVKSRDSGDTDIPDLDFISKLSGSPTSLKGHNPIENLFVDSNVQSESSLSPKNKMVKSQDVSLFGRQISDNKEVSNYFDIQRKKDQMILFSKEKNFWCSDFISDFSELEIWENKNFNLQFFELISDIEEGKLWMVNDFEMDPELDEESIERKFIREINLYEVIKNQISSEELEKEINDYLSKLNGNSMINTLSNIHKPIYTRRNNKINNYLKNQTKMNYNFGQIKNKEINPNLNIQRTFIPDKFIHLYKNFNHNMESTKKNIIRKKKKLNNTTTIKHLTHYQDKESNLSDNYTVEIMQTGEWSSCQISKRLPVFKNMKISNC
jgi:hypothetical protein